MGRLSLVAINQALMDRNLWLLVRTQRRLGALLSLLCIGVALPGVNLNEFLAALVLVVVTDAALIWVGETSSVSGYDKPLTVG